MRLFKTLMLAVALVGLSAAVASANSISLVVTNDGGGNLVGNDVTFGPGGGTVTYDIILNNTDGLASIAISAAFSSAVDAASGTTPGFLFFGAGFISPLGAQWADFTGTALARGVMGATPQGAGIPVGISAGCNCSIGTLTVTTSTSTGVTVGALVPVLDGAADNLFQSVSLDSGTANITVVPEPGTALLMGLGIAGLAFAGRRD